MVSLWGSYLSRVPVTVYFSLREQGKFKENTKIAPFGNLLSRVPLNKVLLYNYLEFFLLLKYFQK